MISVVDQLAKTSLDTQIWMARGDNKAPAKEHFSPVENGALPVKPHHGLWTSTYCPENENESDWIRWCKTEGWHAGREGWRLEPEDDIRVLEIDTMDDLRAVVETYPDDEYYDRPTPFEDHPIDFESIGDDFDAMHLTEEGQVNTRMPGMSEPNLYGWDAECTLWFRWAFQETEHLGRF